MNHYQLHTPDVGNYYHLNTLHIVNYSSDCIRLSTNPIAKALLSVAMDMVKNINCARGHKSRKLVTQFSEERMILMSGMKQLDSIDNSCV